VIFLMILFELDTDCDVSDGTVRIDIATGAIFLMVVFGLTRYCEVSDGNIRIDTLLSLFFLYFISPNSSHS